MDTQESSDPGTRALAAFAEAISKPETRRAFEKNERSLEQMLQDKGASAADLPASVRAFLDDLSGEEMRLLAHFQVTMVAAGFYVEVPSEGLQTDDSPPAIRTLAKF